MYPLNSAKLLQWLVRELEPICTEEPEVLAQYVETLINDEQEDKDELKKNCINELNEFLNSNTNSFVEKLFHAIEDGSYKEDYPDQRNTSLNTSHNDSDRGLSPPENRRNESSVFDDDEEEEMVNHRRRMYDESSDGGNKRQKRDNFNNDSVDEDRRQTSRRHDYGDAQYNGKGGMRNNRSYNNPPGMHMGGRFGYGDDIGYNMNRGPMGGFRGGMWENERAGYPNFNQSQRYGQDMWMNSPSNNMMFPPQQQSFGGGPPPRPPMPPPPPSIPNAGNWREGDDRFNYPPHMPPPHRPCAPGAMHHSLSPDEQFTVKCTGIPHYVKELDLYKHFATFGTVLKLVLIRLGGDGEDGIRQKVYNESLVQFEDLADAKKCLGSPQSVLDNRFIKLFASRENLIPPSEISEHVAREDYEVYPGFQNDQHLLKPNGGKIGRGGKGGGRGHAYDSSFKPPEERSPIDEEAAQQLREQKKLDAKAKREEIREKREEEAKRQYEDLKQLRQQADSITRKKEELLQGQIDQFRSMMSKVEKICGTDEAEKARMIESLENKVMSLQASLQDVRSGVVSSGADTAGIKGFRGKGGGGRGYRGGYKGGGRGGGRGGFKGGRKGNIYGRGGKCNRTLDNRSKCLIISGAPSDFLKSAHLHFSKFGEVVKTSSLANERESDDESPKFLIEFSSVDGAELALRGGLNFNNSKLTAEYKTIRPRADSITSNPSTTSQDGNLMV